MSINEASDDYGLLDVVTSLCKNGRTGRLQINVGTTRGAFFLKEGLLVDARVGTLTGFAAVNLAVSIGATVLNFDSSIEPPAARFNDANERRLLKGRFGIDSAGADVQSPPRSAGQGRLSLVAQATAAAPAREPQCKVEAPETANSVAPLDNVAAVRATAPLAGPTTPLTGRLAATAPLTEVIPPPETVAPLKVTSAPQESPTPAPRDNVVPIRIAAPPPAPAIATVADKTIAPSAVNTAPLTPTVSREVTAPLKDPNAPLSDERGAAPGFFQSVQIASTLDRWKVQAKSNLSLLEKKLRPISHSIAVQGKQSFRYLRNNKTALRVALIALLVIPAVVILASYWSKGNETSPTATPAPLAASSIKAPAITPATTPSAIQPAVTKEAPALSTNAARVRQETPRSSESVVPPRTATAKSADTSRSRSSEQAANVPSQTKENATPVDATPAPEEKQIAKPASPAITVEVRVEGGQVSEAYIKNRRPGMEAYEAAALRQARQRRYSKETTTTETLVFQVKGNQ